MENKGFKKGKIPERFEGKTDEQLAVMQHIMWNSGKTVVEEIDGKITAHVSHYFDEELAAVQIIKKIERLEKALEKACGKIAWLSDDYDNVESLYTVEEWKEWCMKDAE